MITVKIQNFTGYEPTGSNMTFTTFDAIMLALDSARINNVKFEVYLGYVCDALLDIDLKYKVDKLDAEFPEADIGIWTKGIGINAHAETLAKAEFIVITLSLELVDGHSSHSDTSVLLDQYLADLLTFAKSFTRIIQVVLTLTDLEDNVSVDYVTKQLAECANVRVCLSNSQEFLSLLQDSTPYKDSDRFCDQIANEMSISVDGFYDVCCAAEVDKSNVRQSVYDTSIITHMFGESRLTNINYIETNQDIPIHTCADCILLRTFGSI